MAAKSEVRLAFSLVMIAALLAVTPASAGAAQIRPGDWVKYTGNPVLDVGAAGSWNALSVSDPTVLLDGTTYKMWYSGWSGTANTIGYAISADGLAWTPLATNPVLRGTASGWDQAYVRAASVILDAGTYKMWYTGKGATGGARIGYATSTDGIIWIKYASNPVLDVGGGWEANSVVEPSVIKVGSTYHMWYRGRAGDFRGGIGHATSPDGIVWTKDAGNPVIPDAAPGYWDYTAYGPSVLFDGSLFHMWYSGGNFNGTAWEIGYATSTDGILWNKRGRVLPQGADGAFDRYSADYGSVMLDGSTFKMWYSGVDADGYTRIGYASAPLRQITSFTYLPLTLRSYGPCSPVWFDDFSNYHSGWPIISETGYGLAYVGDEYRITIDEDDSYSYATPGNQMTDGVIVTDVRFMRSGHDQDNGGIVFGKSLDNADNFYRFTLTEEGNYCIQRHDAGSGWTGLSCGQAAGYAAYPASNRLKVIRNGSAITGYVNGQFAATVSDGAFTGSLRFGLSAGAAEAGADVRFDNYAVYSIACSGQ